MSMFFTRVETHFGRDLFNFYLRFGESKSREEISPRRAFEYYATGQVFGYVRWQANEYGTQDWHIWVLRAGTAGHLIQRIPGVAPGAEILLDQSGSAHVRRTFEAIDAIEAQDIDPADVPPAYYAGVHQRILTRLPVPAYSPARQRARRIEKAVFG